MAIDPDKLLIFAGAGLAGAVASVTCWGWRSLSLRSVRRPIVSCMVHLSLGAVFGLAASLGVELKWSCEPSGILLSAILSGLAVGLFGPDAVLRRIAQEMELRSAIRRLKGNRLPSDWNAEDDLKD